MLKIKTLLTSIIALLLIASFSSYASSGRYQAYWNGKSFLILDTDHGHMWNYFGDTLQYNGRIDGSDFDSPEESKIWQQSHGKWIRK